MTAPKIYVPAPGRPPEWVVDLMVEGRVHKHHDGKSWFVARETSQYRQRGWWPAQEGEAIRLNEDGSLEIIDAPKEEPKPKYLDIAEDVMREVLERLRTAPAPEPTFTWSETENALRIGWGIADKARSDDAARALGAVRSMLRTIAEGKGYR